MKMKGGEREGEEAARVSPRETSQDTNEKGASEGRCGSMGVVYLQGNEKGYVKSH